LQQDLANLEISAKNFLVKGKPKWKIKPKRFDIFESANIVNNSVKNNAKALETTVCNTEQYFDIFKLCKVRKDFDQSNRKRSQRH
jgi:hypothetical protein